MEKKFTDLFAFDLDGTLVHRSPDTGVRHIPKHLLQIVFEISKKAHIVVATGRRYRAALEDLQKLPPVPYAVVHNGLVIRDTQGQVVERSTITLEEARKVADVLSEHLEDFFFVCDGYDHAIDYLYLESALKRSQNLQRVEERMKEHRHLLQNLEELSSFKHLPLLEVAALGNYSDLLKIQKTLTLKLPADFRAIVVKNIGYEGSSVLEIFKRQYSKWSGVAWVKAKLGATRVIAVGDDENDLEMIRSADMGVAMKHAEPNILQASKAQVDGPEGLSEFLREFYIG
jgi:HAD superfamily hydrolase (TIGR01484 family)